MLLRKTLVGALESFGISGRANEAVPLEMKFGPPPSQPFMFIVIETVFVPFDA
jgi:hypothetical protein